MAPTKHRDDQLFTAPVDFNDSVIFNDLATFEGLATFNDPAVFNDPVTFGGLVIRTSRQLLVPACDALAGATAGWVVTGADDGLARLPASQTNSTLVIPIKGLFIGDIVIAARVIGQVESAGADVTLVLSFRKTTAAIGDFVDAELGTDNVGTLTADTLLSGSALEVAGLTETLDELETLYALLTGTTAAVTDIAVSGLVIDLTQN